jgi:DNA-binding NarL/FixJ family response regulator
MAATVLLCDSAEAIALLQYALIRSDADLRVEVVLDGYHAVEMAERIHPDVIVTELDVEGLAGSDLVRRLRTASPDSKILCWTTVAATEPISQVVAAGASGVLLKETGPEEVAAAIEPVLQGNVVLSPSVAETLGERLTASIRHEPELEAAHRRGEGQAGARHAGQGGVPRERLARVPDAVTIAKGIAYVLKNKGIARTSNRSSSTGWRRRSTS